MLTVSSVSGHGRVLRDIVKRAGIRNVPHSNAQRRASPFVYQLLIWPDDMHLRQALATVEVVAFAREDAIPQVREIAEHFEIEVRTNLTISYVGELVGEKIQPYYGQAGQIFRALGIEDEHSL